MWILFASLIAGVAAAFIYNRIDSIKFREISKDKRAILHYQHKQVFADMTTVPKFTFDQFLKFYNLNPEAWEIMSVTNFLFIPARVKYEEYNPLTIWEKIYRTNYEYYPIFWYDNYEFKKHQQNELQKKQNEATKQILEFVQADIDKIRAENEATLQKTEEVLMQSLQNLRKEATERRMTSNGVVEDTYYCGVESNGKIAKVVTEKQLYPNDIPLANILPSRLGYKIVYQGQNIDINNLTIGDVVATVGKDGFIELIQKISEKEFTKLSQ